MVKTKLWKPPKCPLLGARIHAFCPSIPWDSLQPLKGKRPNYMWEKLEIQYQLKQDAVSIIHVSYTPENIFWKDS